MIDTPDWSKIPTPRMTAPPATWKGSHAVRALPATDGNSYDFAALEGLGVVYAYPRTGRPGVDNPVGWDMIPGARGCTPQSCSFRDHFAELKALGVKFVFGLSTQRTDYQREAATRLHLQFAILSDEHLALAHAMKLPTFRVDGMTLLKRLTMILRDGVVQHVFYPVFPPDRDPLAVMDWLANHVHPREEPCEASRSSG